MKEKIIAVLGMVAILLIAYGLDYWVDLSQQLASKTFNYSPFIWGAGLANLFFANETTCKVKSRRWLIPLPLGTPQVQQHREWKGAIQYVSAHQALVPRISSNAFCLPTK